MARMDRHAVPDEEQLVEQFKPTGGFILGYTALAVVAGLLVYVAVEDRSVTGLRVALGSVFIGVVVWATQIRPRASATRDTLFLRNSARDTEVPLALIDTVLVRQTLNVFVGTERYICIGIGSSRRKLTGRKQHSTSFLGLTSTPTTIGDTGGAAASQEPSLPYERWVSQRIEELAKDARARGTTRQVRHRIVVPVVAGLVVSGLAFALSLLL